MYRLTFLLKRMPVAALLLAMATQAHAIPLIRPNQVTIWGDRGGEVIQYALRAKKMKAQGRSLRFAGRCDSACTLYLSMPRSLACVSPGASFGFHLPYGASQRGNRIAANYMMKSYPGWVRNWISANGGLSNRIKTMNYAYAARYLPTCGGRASVNI